MTTSLDGRVAVVTGSTRSIGFGIAKAFLASGAAVVLSGRSEAKGKEALTELDAGDRAAFHACDSTRQSDVEGLIDWAVEQFGHVDILVNNAGGSRGFAMLHELSSASALQAQTLPHSPTQAASAPSAPRPRSWGSTLDTNVASPPATKPSPATATSNTWCR